MNMQFRWQDKILKSGIKRGAYSHYIKINKNLGIKILRNKTQFLTIESLRRSGLWKSAVKEFNLLMDLAELELCPIPDEVIPVFCETTHSYVPGIQMEHISGKPLSHFYFKKPKLSFNFLNQSLQAPQLQEALVKFIKSHGVIHRDLHFGNILIESSGRVRVIDLGLAHRVK